MRIKLISPKRLDEWGESFWDLKTLSHLTRKKAGGAPLALPTLAALTPGDIEVILTDENVETIDFNEHVDLVGITGMTCVIPRAYAIADEFRKRGVLVIMGGIHASMLPEEAAQHSDAVVIGEAEEIWQQVIEDARKGSLQKTYRTSGFPDLTHSPIPRWDLLKNQRYCYFTIQTGRGCPYDCEFCTVKEFNGREYRHKRIDIVVEEIKKLQAIDTQKLIFFTDDNLLSIPAYAQDLFKRLVPLKIKNWMCQSSINRLSNDTMLDLMYAAGCRVIFVGFESISQPSVASMNKDMINKTNEYKGIIEKVHKHKMSIFGSFILGSDTDTDAIFKETARFIQDTHIAFSMINIMTLLPGSKVFARLKAEQRALGFEWWKANADWACYRPKLISQQQLEDGQTWLLKDIYSYPRLYERLQYLWNKGIFVRQENKTLFSKTRFLISLLSLLSFNTGEVKFILKSLWNKQCTSIMWILTGLNYHQYAYKHKRKPHV
ncbi:MAG: radical SAM protein [Candidatus Omnitrophota bacterium]|jgi:radical SAM superfamily enzyme YgiQ (UPF0313 family)